MTAVLVIAVFSIDRPRLRSQYLVCFVLAWTILGTIGAIVFASMGPCFFDLAYPGEDNPFGPLMAYLKEVNQTYPVWALTAQDMLREYYLANRLGFGRRHLGLPEHAHRSSCSQRYPRLASVAHGRLAFDDLRCAHHDRFGASGMALRRRRLRLGLDHSRPLEAERHHRRALARARTFRGGWRIRCERSRLRRRAQNFA